MPPCPHRTTTQCAESTILCEVGTILYTASMESVKEYSLHIHIHLNDSIWHPPPPKVDTIESQFLHLSRWQLLFGLLPSIFLLYHTLLAIYNVYFHPLRALRGPRSWVAFPILCNISSCLGTYDRDMRSFHSCYGEVVRYHPSQASFITAAAWKDIYGHKHPQLPKALAR